MIRWLCPLSLFLFAVAVGGASSSAFAKTITMFIENKTPGFDVTAFLEKSPNDTVEFVRNRETKRLEYRIVIPPDRWFVRATVRVVWKGVWQNGSIKEDFPQRVYFRFSRNLQKEDQPLLVYFGNEMSGDEIDRLERLKKLRIANDLPEVFFRSYQIAQHYRLLKHPGVFKRVTNIAFEAAQILAEQPNSVYELGEEVEKAAIEGDAARKQHFEDLALVVRKKYWDDEFNRIELFASERNCDSARLIFGDLQKRQKEEPREFNAASMHRNWQKDTANIIRAKCRKIRNKRKQKDNHSVMMMEEDAGFLNRSSTSSLRRSSARRWLM